MVFFSPLFLLLLSSASACHRERESVHLLFLLFQSLAVVVTDTFVRMLNDEGPKLTAAKRKRRWLRERGEGGETTNNIMTTD
jgi:hypothetical protein